MSPEAVDLFLEYQSSTTFDFRITKPRNSKHGDFKYELKGNKAPVISVNGNLNTHAFLFTFLHEYAHLITVRQHGKAVQAHGKEWKDSFRSLLKESLERKLFPDDVAQAIVSELCKLKSTTMGNKKIFKALSRYDEGREVRTYVEDLLPGTKFRLGERTFVIEKKRRSRYLCTEVKSGKQYLVQGVSPVELVS